MNTLNIGGSFTKRLGSVIAPSSEPGPLVTGRQSIILTLDDIEDEDWNPRLTKNPEYDNIKNSIRSVLLDAPITVTKRPGAEKYIRRAGGKTRYTILRELYEETGDEKYFRLEFYFVPWTNEIDVVAGHATENLLRAGLNFYEQACQERHLFTVITEQNPDFATASIRGRSERYIQHGYIVTTAYLSLFDYIHAELLPHLEKQLVDGMGYRQVSQIRAIQKEYQPVFDYHSSTTGNTEWFASVLHQYSERASTHDTQLLRNTITDYLSEHFQISPKRLTSAEPPSKSGQPAAEKTSQAPAANPCQVSQSTGNEDDTDPINRSSSGSSLPDLPSPDIESGSRSDHDSGTSEQAPPVDSEEQRLLIREKASTIALSLASEYGLLEGCISTGQDIGLGYTLDHPDTIDMGAQSSPIDTLFIYQQLHALAFAVFQHDLSRVQSGPVFEKLRSVLSSPSISDVTDSAIFRETATDQLWWRFQYHLTHAHIAHDHQPTSARLIEQLNELSQLATRYVTIER